MAPTFREFTEADASPRGMFWSWLTVGVLVLAVGIYFLGDWLHWF